MKKGITKKEANKEVARICLILFKYYKDITPTFMIEMIAKEIVYSGKRLISELPSTK